MEPAADEGTYILTNLGLTPSEAKVFLVLSHLGLATAKNIATASGIAREQVYRIIPQLKELGLIEEVIGRPTMYNPVNLKDAISFLVNRRLAKTDELREKADNFLQKTLDKPKIRFEEEKQQFVLIPEKEAYLRRIKNSHINAKRSIDIITTRNRLPLAIFSFADEAKEALRKGVKLRIITESFDQKTLYSVTEGLNVPEPLKVKFIRAFPPAVILIYDKKEVIFVTSATSDLLESPALWSINPSLVSIFIDFFEMVWSEAKEHE
ncbi:MAG: helix-turn-helix domain-containing protein [Candidatus Bathyarchaeia archaeon]